MRRFFFLTSLFLFWKNRKNSCISLFLRYKKWYNRETRRREGVLNGLIAAEQTARGRRRELSRAPINPPCNLV